MNMERTVRVAKNMIERTTAGEEGLKFVARR